MPINLGGPAQSGVQADQLLQKLKKKRDKISKGCQERSVLK